MTMLTVDEVARLFRVSRDVVEKWIAEGAVLCVKDSEGAALMPLSGLQEAIADRGLLDGVPYAD